MYSQNQEEKFITEYFKDSVGKFIDIGAYDGITFSNTRRLYELGWKGVLIEPSDYAFNKLIELYNKDEEIFLLKTLVSEYDVSVDFYESTDAVSTTEISNKEKWEKNVEFIKTTKPSLSVKRLIKFYGECDFLNIDTEGTSNHILNLFPDEYLEKVKCICIEYDNEFQTIAMKLTNLNFKIVYCNGENIIAVK